MGYLAVRRRTHEAAALEPASARAQCLDSPWSCYGTFCALAHLGADRGALPVVEGWGLLGLLASW
jgi:hypothetical protein